jgi:hypothetical protein
LLTILQQCIKSNRLSILSSVNNSFSGPTGKSLGLRSSHICFSHV